MNSNVQSSAGSGPNSSVISPDAETNKWKLAYEKVVRDNEKLRTQGGDALLLQQMRERYEGLMKENEDLQEKLRVYTRAGEIKASLTAGGSTSLTSPGSSALVAPKSLEQQYIELKDEYKEYRRRITSLENQRQSEIEELRALLDINRVRQGGGIVSMNGSQHMVKSLSGGALDGLVDSGNGSQNGKGGSGGNGGGLSESRLAYIRSMVLQYLSCRDTVVKPHIESALVAIFRYNEEERASIGCREEDPQDTLSQITSFLSGFS
jgi:hypothetical protein